MKFYTGIGSRETPREICELFISLALKLAGEGWTLRSGHAMGADWAFECGANQQSHIYLPWRGFGQSPYHNDPGRPVLGTAFTLDNYKTSYDKLVRLGIRSAASVKDAVKLLHGRNFNQVLGHPAYPEASRFVVCWCPVRDGEPQGGTATAVKLAQHHRIPVFNLFEDAGKERVEAWLAREA